MDKKQAGKKRFRPKLAGQPRQRFHPRSRKVNRIWLKEALEFGRRIRGNKNVDQGFVNMYFCEELPQIRRFLKALDLSEDLCDKKLRSYEIKTGIDLASYVWIATKQPTRLNKDLIEILSSSRNSWEELKEEHVFGLAMLRVGEKGFVSEPGVGQIDILCSRLPGMGQSLLQSVLAHARRLGLDRVSLMSLRSSILFYRKFGFVNTANYSCDEHPELVQLAAKVKPNSTYTVDDFVRDLLRRKAAISRIDFPMVYCFNKK